MFAFADRTKEQEVQRSILRLVNTHCNELEGLREGPRLEGRANLTVPAWVVPYEGKKLQIAKAFTAVSKEFSPSGFSVIIQRPFAAQRIVVGFYAGEEKLFFEGDVQHISPLGIGYS